jgi:RNA polymerase sigma-70 factor (family 1)
MAAYSKYSDQELAALLKAGDRLAFTEVYDRYHVLLLRHAAGKLSDGDQAMDVVQDVFVRLWEKCAQLQIGTSLSGYLYSAVRNQIFDFIKHQKVIHTYTESMMTANEAKSVWADHQIREKQFAAMIEAEIQSLPPRMREVFQLRRMENLSTREVAERLGITENTATDQLRKAMKILRLKIGLILVLASMIDQNL